MLLLPTCRYILNFSLLQLNQIDLFGFTGLSDPTATAILANLIYYIFAGNLVYIQLFFFTQLVKFRRTFFPTFMSFRF